MSVRLSFVRRGIITILLFALVLVDASSSRLQAQGPDPVRHWTGGTTLLAPLLDGSGGTGLSSPFANAVSADGRFVVFKTSIATIVPGDTNGVDDIFLYDRLTNETTRVSVSSSGDQANAASDYPSISTDGRFITFASSASNLTAGDTNGHWDVFVVDRVTHTTSLVSRSTADTPSSGDSTASMISADGRFVAFLSTSYDLAPGIVGNGQLFLRDRDVDGNGILDEPGNVRTTVISVADDGSYAEWGCYSFSMTPDGRFVAFSTNASNLVPGDTNGSTDIFVRDLQAGHTWRASVASDGSEAAPSFTSGNPRLTPDGRFVVFSSYAANLVPDDTNGQEDVFLHDSQTGETTRVSLSTDGVQGDYGSNWPSVSDDGRYVAFTSLARTFGGPTTYFNAYVRDRQLGTTTAINRDANGVAMPTVSPLPWISGDGSTVIFGGGNAFVSNLYAAVDFSVTPTSVAFEANGTEQTFTVTAPATTGWAVVPAQPWLTPSDGDSRAGSGTLRVTAMRNTGTTTRSSTLTIGPKTITVTQAAGFSVQSIAPASGTGSGGTLVTITGSGLMPGASARFGGVLATTTTVVSDTTMTAVTPPHAEGLVDVQVVNGDGGSGMLTGAYRFNDTTPPVIQPLVTGPLGNNGWYIGNVTIAWSVTDAESAVTFTSGCNTITATSDTYPTTTYTCSAISHGGTGSATYTLRRDTTPPTWSVTSPLPTIYTPGQSVTANYTCTDPYSAGLDTCVGSQPIGSLVDTSTPGFHDFTVTAMDKAGWSSTGTVTYGVASGVCTPTPTGIVSWWTGDNVLTDLIGFNNGTLSGSIASGGMFDPGLVGAGAFRFTGSNAYNFGHDPSLKMTTAYTVTAWVYANGSYRNGAIFKKVGEYGLELGSSYLYYYFGSTSAKFVNYAIKQNAWTHVAMTYDAGALTIYANGRPVATAAVPATLVDAVPNTDDFVVGGQQFNPSSYFFASGDIDDVQVYRRALASTELESMFLSGPAGTCVPPATTLTVSPASATYGPSATTTLTAQLMSAGAGVAGRTLAFSLSGTPVGTAVTDSDGNASLTISIAGKTAGTYSNAVRVSQVGDPAYQSSAGIATLTIAKAPIIIVWPTPAPIVYGTNLSSMQFNATTTPTLGGSFAYTPNITSTPPNAGPLTLSATFTPTDTANYLPSTASVVLQVLPATPTITVNTGTFTYDKQTHQATASATGVRGDTFPYTVTYNGSSALPVDAGDYTVVVSVDATQNYNAASVTASTPLTIRKATPTATVGTLQSYYVYDRTAHAAIASATGVGGDALTPVTITYNGDTEPPVNAGTYTLLASYAGSQNYEAASASGVLTIRKATVSLSASIAGLPAYDGTPHTIASASATGVGGEVLTPVTVTYNGDTAPPVNAGDYTVVVSYAASQNYDAASMTAGTFTISKATPTVNVTGGGTFVYDGSTHAATATVTGAGGETLTPVTITYNGGSTVPTNAGTYNVIASYAGAPNYFARNGSATITITKASVTVSWPAPPAIVYGTPLGAGQLNASASVPGTWSYSPSAGTVLHRGNVNVQGTFTPTDATNYNSIGAAQIIVITPAPLVMKANDVAKPFGAPVPIFSASYAGFVNGDTPASLSGTLGFSTSATAQSPVGTYAIAVGGVISNDYAISFVPGVLTVQPAATSTAVIASANPSGVNQPITFTASVSVTAPGAGQPTGTLRFLDGSLVLGDVPMQNGTASLTTGLATSAHAIVATYLGDASFAGSQGSLTQTVNASSSSTTTTLSSSLNPSKSGQSVTLTAHVTSPAGTPTGTVQFLDRDVLIGTGTLSSGTATLTTTTLAVGSHALTVRYLGSATLPPSLSATLVQVVNTASVKTKTTTMSLNASPSPGTLGTQTTFTATVAPPVLMSAPTGSVLFEIDGVSATTVTLTASGRNGIATLHTTTLARGKHLVTVTYLGDGTYAGSTATVTYTVN